MATEGYLEYLRLILEQSLRLITGFPLFSVISCYGLTVGDKKRSYLLTELNTLQIGFLEITS